MTFTLITDDKLIRLQLEFYQIFKYFTNSNHSKSVCFLLFSKFSISFEYLLTSFSFERKYKCQCAYATIVTLHQILIRSTSL